MSTDLADALHEKGFYSAEEVASCSVEELLQVRDFSEDEASALIEKAQTWVLEKEKEDAERAKAEAEAREAAAAESPEVEEEVQEEDAGEGEAAVAETPPAGENVETGDEEGDTPESSE
jgi:N utilization substance protein A